MPTKTFQSFSFDTTEYTKNPLSLYSLLLTQSKKMAQRYPLHRFGPILLAPLMVLLLMTTMSKYSGHHSMIRRSLVSIMPPIIRSTTTTRCKRNAIAYFVEKHSTSKSSLSNNNHNDKDHDKEGTYGQLTKSLDLLFDHYLLSNLNYESTSVFLFHTGDYNEEDLAFLEWRYPLATKGTLQLVNVADSTYWTLPMSLSEHKEALELSESQLAVAHKTRFMTMGIYDFLEQTNHLHGCSFEHVLQLEESSFIYSPLSLEGELFADMTSNNYMLQYRLCEPPTSVTKDHQNMQIAQLLHDYAATTQHYHHHHHYNPKTEVDTLSSTLDHMCFPSTSFLVTSLPFMKSRPVQRYLSFFENHIYTTTTTATLGEGLSHSSIVAGMMVQGYDGLLLEAPQIHRRLDFTFFGSNSKHSVNTSQNSKCPTGTLQAGYQDLSSDRTMSEFRYIYDTRQQCQVQSMEEHVELHVNSDFVVRTMLVQAPFLTTTTAISEEEPKEKGSGKDTTYISPIVPKVTTW